MSQWCPSQRHDSTVLASLPPLDWRTGGRWRGGAWPQPKLGEAGKRARPFSKMRGHFLGPFPPPTHPRRRLPKLGDRVGSEAVAPAVGEVCPKDPYVNPHSYPPGLTSAAWPARSQRVNPIAEGSARSAPCALARRPGTPRRSAYAEPSPGWRGAGPRGRGRW